MSANMSADENIAVEGLEEQAAFLHGLLFALAFSLPIWGVLIAVARLVA